MKEFHPQSSELGPLLELATLGHEPAADELIARASDRLMRLTSKMLRNYPRLHRWEETDDVFQEAVTRLHRALKDVHVDSARAFYGLAATQIRRTLIDLARHHFGPHGKHRLHHSDQAGRAADDSGGPLRQVSGKADQPESLEEWANFHEAVENLPEDEREVFEMVWYGDAQQQEIAELLDVSVPTVKRRWRAARLHLYSALDGQSPALD